jgi:hypothetical protein
MLGLRPKKLAIYTGALAAIACIRIFLGYGGHAFGRNTIDGTRMREETFEERWR